MEASTFSSGAANVRAVGGPQAPAGMRTPGAAQAPGTQAPGTQAAGVPGPGAQAPAEAPAPGASVPAGISHPERTAEQRLEMCGNAVAFILALGGEPGDIGAALREARAARCAAAYVLARPEHAPAAMEAVRLSGGKGRTLVQAVEYDVFSAIDLTRNAADFELFSQLPFGLLETMRVIADSLLDTYEHVLALDAAQDRVTADHVYALCEDAREHPEAEVVVSWIEQLRRLPCLVSRDFLERISARDPRLLGEGGGVRPVPVVRTRDHVFDGEKLAAAPAAPKQVGMFRRAHTMTALESVRRACEPPEGDCPSKPLNPSDALLAKAARDAMMARDGLSSAEMTELAWADEFGRRNKLDFPLLNDRAHAGTLVYLDSAATTQRPAPVLRALEEFDARENANVYRGAYELSARSTAHFARARQRIAAFMGADPERLVFTLNATGAVNLVAQAWGSSHVGEGDLIVCELAAHHANYLPFLLLARRTGARVECVPYGEDGRVDLETYARLLEQRPKLVCVAQVGNVFGIEAPVARMAAAAHDAGARVLVDAAQSFPHAKIDAHALGADWLAVSAHKAYGPMGIGALWAAPDAFDEMEPCAAGGGTVTHVSASSLCWRAGAARFEAGTPAVSQAVGWAAACDYLETLGMHNVERHAAVLTRYAARGLGALDGVNVLGDRSAADAQCGLVPFTVRSVAPGDIARFLGDLGVAIRSGGHCALPLHASLGMIGTGRISVGVHTTREDIDAAVAAVALCRKLYES